MKGGRRRAAVPEEERSHQRRRRLLVGVTRRCVDGFSLEFLNALARILMTLI